MSHFTSWVSTFTLWGTTYTLRVKSTVRQGHRRWDSAACRGVRHGGYAWRRRRTSMRRKCQKISSLKRLWRLWRFLGSLSLYLWEGLIRHKLFRINNFHNGVSTSGLWGQTSGLCVNPTQLNFRFMGLDFSLNASTHISFTIWCAQFHVMVYQFHVMRKPTGGEAARPLLVKSSHWLSRSSCSGSSFRCEP